jgi:secreted PhoX family phosphatase
MRQGGLPVLVSRRRFVHAAASAAFLGLARAAGAQGRGVRGGAPPVQPYRSQVEGFGPLIDDPTQVLDLPAGFRYRILSRQGESMSDGLRLPTLPDGMAAFPGPDGRVIVVRNHEIPIGAPPHVGPFGYQLEHLAGIDTALIYDATASGRPHGGGTTTFVYNPATGAVERQFLSLVGTVRNCAGGPTPWNTWISCEEAVDPAGDVNLRAHGYCFEVPATTTIGITPPVPLTAMGRFYHEAVAVDPDTGVVYLTEDRVDGLFYRFLPATPGRLADGGRLQALAVRTRDTFDTRNFAELGAPGLQVGDRVPVRWIDLDEVEAPDDDLRTRGAAAGAAIFARGEGLWFGRNQLYFACTSGGVAQRGQVFRYVPSPDEGTPAETATPGMLELFVEPNDAFVLESVDNLTVTPWGDLLLCEDTAAPANVVAPFRADNYLRGVTPDGQLYTFARNRYPGGSELSGACFSPDGATLFVNIMEAGLTLAITGPWEQRRA